MTSSNPMTRRLAGVATVVALAVGSFTANPAQAACSQFGPAPDAGPSGKHNPATNGAYYGGSFLKVSGQAVDDEGFRWDGGIQRFQPAIVGLWNFTFISEGNNKPPLNFKDGMTLDQGFVTWHEDGSELMNSGRSPVTQSFCMGTWKQTGRYTYQLKHMTLSWTPDPTDLMNGATFVGPGLITETITVSRDGSSYTGQFTIDQFQPDGKTPVAVGGHLTGNIKATRITVD